MVPSNLGAVSVPQRGILNIDEDICTSVSFGGGDEIDVVSRTCSGVVESDGI